MLEAEAARKLAEARERGESIALVMWDRETARRLGAPTPEPSTESTSGGCRFILIDPDTGLEIPRRDYAAGRGKGGKDIEAPPGGKIYPGCGG